MKQPWEWVESDIASLISNRVQEDLSLDYKACAALEESDKKKAELSKDVSAFANSAGGTLVYGVCEDAAHFPSVNNLPGKRLARAGSAGSPVVDGVGRSYLPQHRGGLQQVGEIALHPGCVRYGRETVAGALVAVKLRIEHEEGLVLAVVEFRNPDRSGDFGAEIVLGVASLRGTLIVVPPAVGVEIHVAHDLRDHLYGEFCGKLSFCKATASCQNAI
jgi:hypothetical protein